MKKIILILLMFILIGCQPIIKTVYVPVKLHHDPRPVLPKIKESELQCLTQKTYQKLFDQKRLIIEYAIGLETIIDSTH